MIGYTLVEFKLALLYFINVDGLQAEFIKRLHVLYTLDYQDAVQVIINNFHSSHSSL